MKLNMEKSVKIILSGLDNAGKTSILTALDKKFDFQQEVAELKPTFKIEYKKTSFLNLNVMIWDMGGQEQFRQQYKSRAEVYFADTDLLVYVIDIQDEERFEESLEYLHVILNYFKEIEQDTPVILAFHKYDLEIRSEENVNNSIEILRERILENYADLKILFQQTSIYDIISIVQLVSYGLSVFDEKFFELSELLESYITKLNCSSLILFDESGIIISEFYSDSMTPDLYVHLLESIKEHLFLLKRMQEEDYKGGQDFYNLERGLISYLYRVEIKKIPLYISIVVKESLKESLLDNFEDFLNELTEIVDSIL